MQKEVIKMGLFRIIIRILSFGLLGKKKEDSDEEEKLKEKRRREQEKLEKQKEKLTRKLKRKMRGIHYGLEKSPEKIGRYEKRALRHEKKARRYYSKLTDKDEVFAHLQLLKKKIKEIKKEAEEKD